MSAKPSTTIGFERRFNPMLRVEGEAGVRRGGEPRPRCPSRRTCRPSSRSTAARSCPARRCRSASTTCPADAPLLDVRASEAYAAGHAPGALHAPASQTGFGNRVGWLLGAEDARGAGGRRRGARPSTRRGCCRPPASCTSAAGWRPSRSGPPSPSRCSSWTSSWPARTTGRCRWSTCASRPRRRRRCPAPTQVPLRLVAGADLGGPRPGAADRGGLRRGRAGRDGRRRCWRAAASRTCARCWSAA